MYGSVHCEREFFDNNYKSYRNKTCMQIGSTHDNLMDERNVTHFAVQLNVNGKVGHVIDCIIITCTIK